MTTITNKKQYPSEQYLNELITNIEFAARAPVEVVRAMAAELQKRREADSAEPASNHEELPLDYLQGQKDGLEWAAQLAEANHPQTGDWLYDDPLELAKAIRKGPDMPEFDGPTPVTPARLPGGFTIEDAKELHENLVRSHISQALSGEKMKKKDREADLRWIHDVIVQAAWFVKASLEALPEPPQEVK
ncbi:Eaa protein [Escherichia coli]